jgi:peptide-methionine (S)-S-oxide reductase
MRGVERVIVGYTGGKQPNPTYQTMQDHTEALFIEFNPKKVSYWEILEMWQDNNWPWKRDRRQYRSAIFWTSLAQQDQGLSFLERLRETYPKRGRLYVDVELATKFYQAEEYHQNYLGRRQLQTEKKTECLSNVCVPVWKKRNQSKPKIDMGTLLK